MLASGGGEAAKKHAEALEASQRIGEDNIGHRMLRGMGWQDGQGLGASASGMAAPLAAGAAKAAQDKIGLGAAVCAWATHSAVIVFSKAPKPSVILAFLGGASASGICQSRAGRDRRALTLALRCAPGVLPFLSCA